MATAPSTFPTLPSGKNQDAAKYSVVRIDNGMRQETDGGYAITRARFTRKPPLTFKIGFTSISNADYTALDDFIAAVGTYKAFNWTNTADTKTYTVRLKEMPEFTHTGAGATRLWDCSMTLEQV